MNAPIEAFTPAPEGRVQVSEPARFSRRLRFAVNDKSYALREKPCLTPEIRAHFAARQISGDPEAFCYSIEMNLPSTLQRVRGLTWPDVFGIWRDAEIHSETWRALYTKRGFDTWEAWRLSFAEPLKLSTLTWSLYEVQKPEIFILDCIGGPYRGWFERYYNGRYTPTFRDLANVSALQQHTGIRQIQKHFPPETTLIAVHVENTIVIIEGMHRSVALALSVPPGKPLRTHVRLALAQHPDATLPLL